MVSKNLKTRQVQEFKETEIGKIPIDWEVKKIDRLFHVLAGGDLSKISFSKNKSVEYKFPIYSNSLNDKGLYGFSKEYQYEPECITITARGNVGRSEYRKEPFNAIVRLLVLKPKQKLSCYFITEFINTRLDFSHVGSAQNQLTATMISERMIAFPPLQEQEQIAKILFDLDSKIQLLQNQNEVLEQIAQAIFKSWFIDFDGVTEFDNSELGQIPKGWKTSILDTIANNPRDPITVKDMDSNILYIGLEHMPRGTIELANWESALGLKSNKFKFTANQILFGKLRPYFKKVGIAPIDGICSTDILVLDSKEPSWLEFLLFIVTSEDFIQFANQSSTGTRMPRADWNFMKKYTIILPPSSKILEFHEIIKNYIKMIKKNIFIIISLSKTRDILLSKLMSGEIRI